MTLLHHRTHNIRYLARTVMLGGLLIAMDSHAAMEPMEDSAMADVSGAGIALGFEDSRWLTKPTSYYEQMGSDPVGASTFQRADMRWYGLSITAIGEGAGGRPVTRASTGISQATVLEPHVPQVDWLAR